MSNYPPGADGPDAPWNQIPFCEVCGKVAEDKCVCPECPQCGAVGNPDCYPAHGMIRTQEQLDSAAAAEEDGDYFDDDF